MSDVEEFMNETCVKGYADQCMLARVAPGPSAAILAKPCCDLGLRSS